MDKEFCNEIYELVTEFQDKSNESHPLMDEVTKLGELIEKYEDKNTPELLEK